MIGGCNMDVYELITNKITEKLESGKIPWKKEWIGKNGARNYVTGKTYSLLNQLLLGDPGEYVTYKQAKEAGGYVKKGARGKFVTFTKQIPADKEAAKDAEERGELYTGRIIYMLRYYTVFNISTDCEGLTPRHQGTLHNFDPIEKAENVIANYVQREGVTIQHIAQGKASYSPSHDRVILPIKEQFSSSAGYYSVAYHELIHSTGHEKRLDRISGNAAFGSEDYGTEELVAELGSAYILNTIGIETESLLTNTAAYIQNWLNAIKKDKRTLIVAAAKAEKAVALILGEQE